MSRNFTACDDVALETLAGELGRRLLARGLKLVTAESCTGGWIAKCVTDIAGSSEWFERGYVTYSNEAKRENLGVSADSLSLHGAVSEQAVREMAMGAAQRGQAPLAVAVSGIAGPDGGSADKPVGTVWIAWHWPDRHITARSFRFDGDREAVRRQAVAAALQGLLDGLGG
ncbi:MAG TPA: nicotinamide-nucleotide amidase [Gammaproteobacteria bacterium]|nr:nicotinamide-nucleotide amidase [Gammaproteobacteria bacterium]